MAIDTATKRFSLIGFGENFNLHTIPQGSVNAGERATLMDLYSGIPLASPAIGGNTIATYANIIYGYRHRRR